MRPCRFYIRNRQSSNEPHDSGWRDRVFDRAYQHTQHSYFCQPAPWLPQPRPGEDAFGHVQDISGWSRQFSEGFDKLSITRTPTGPFCERRLSPSCSRNAVIKGGTTDSAVSSGAQFSVKS